MTQHRAVEKLQALIRIPTVSYPDWSQVDTAAFDALLVEMERQFPVLHERLELTRFDTHGLLFHWPGRSSERPVVLMAHLDVVPVDDGAPWRHPAFGAEIHDGAIWGRGTLDDKGQAVAVCEAVETLLEEGFVPAQDVWLSFGCNEEVSGTAAPLAVQELRRRGVRPWFVMDEGGAVAAEAFPGVAVPIGVVGVTEKGVTSLELRVDGRGGHASTPARNGPTVRLAKALARLDRHQMGASVPDPTVELLRRMAPHASAALKPLMANAARLRPLLTRALIAAGPEPAAMTRTTFAITTLSGSPAINVIASTARAGVNIRIMVGDTVASVLEHVRKTIGDDQVQVTVVDDNEPSPISPYLDDDAFGLIESTITEVFPDAIAAPYVMMAATDSRFFTEICSRVYRFAPFRMTKAQRESIHSYDEHLGVDAFVDGVRWYQRLIERIPDSMATPTTPTSPAGQAARGLFAIVGFLVCVEIASGVLQGYYTPIFSDIADHLGISDADLNWFEAAQLIVSALVVPPLARLGDLIGHKQVLLLSTAVTALGSWVMALAPGFTTFLIGAALQGAYVVWLPLEVAIIHRRTAGTGRQHQLTRRAAGILVGALELAVIIGALTSGALLDATSMTFLLMLPAIVVTVVLFVIWFGIEEMEGTSTGGLDWTGLGLLTASLGLVMGGLIVVRLDGVDSIPAWLLVVAGIALQVPFARYELRQEEPMVDVRLLRTPGQWPVQLTAFLFGMSVLGAQIPLSTFARTDPDVAGYGLGASAGFVSTLIGVYVIFMAIGAFSLPLTSRAFGPRGALVGSSVLVAIGYGMWLFFHDSTGQALMNMAVIGLGSGALVAALPAAAAAAAPAERTGFATGMTNATKTVGGAIASAVFAIALSATGSLEGPEEGHAALSGYMTVWAVCAVAALLAAVALTMLPKQVAEEPTPLLR